MTLDELYDRTWEALPGASPGELAREVLDRSVDYEEVLDILHPAVLTWVHEAERARVRAREQQVFEDPAPPGQHGDETQEGRAGRGGHGEAGGPYLNPADEAMRALLRETCYIPGQGRVRWGSMTPDLHRQRIAFLEQTRDAYVAGVNATVARHQLAAGLLEYRDCPTLDDYVERFGELPQFLESGQEAGVNA